MAALPKLSERMIEFAKPLLDLLSQTAHDRGAPLDDGHRDHRVEPAPLRAGQVARDRRHRATFDKTIERMPPIIAKVLADMLLRQADPVLDRRQLHPVGDDPRLGFAEVIDDGDGNTKIVAMGGLMGER